MREKNTRADAPPAPGDDTGSSQPDAGDYTMLSNIIAALQEIVDSAEGRDLTPEEVERYEALEARLTAARTTQEIRSRQRAYTTPAGARLHTMSVNRREDTIERAFEAYIRTGQVNQDIVELRAQGDGTSTAGGYLVPTIMRDKIVEVMKAFGGFAPEATSFTTGDGRPVEYPVNDDTSNTGEIVAEAGTFAAGADIIFSQRTLGAYKFYAGGASNLPIKVSFELLQDSAFDVTAFITKAIGTRIARGQAPLWLTGTGTGQPQGVLTPKSVYATTASTTTPTYAELVKTVHALDPAYRTGAKWLMNDSTLSLVRQMVDGNGRPLWLPQQESGMSMPMPGGTLLGYPVVIDQAVPSIAASGSTKYLAFGDWNAAYILRRVKDLQIVVLHELYAPTGQVGIFGWERADGAVQDSSAYVILGSHS